jgi:hypothetical protein
MLLLAIGSFWVTLLDYAFADVALSVLSRMDAD